MNIARKSFNILTACTTVASLALFTSCGGDRDDHSGHDQGEHAVHDTHQHDGEKDYDHALKDSGPNGGRILTEVEPHLEFLLLPDHKVQITALSEDAKAIPIGDQVVTITGGDRNAPTDLKFAKQGDVLISDSAFPKGVNLPVIVKIQTAADVEPVFARFALNLIQCPDCLYQEYACVCAHGH